MWLGEDSFLRVFCYRSRRVVWFCWFILGLFFLVLEVGCFGNRRWAGGEGLRFSELMCIGALNSFFFFLTRLR